MLSHIRILHQILQSRVCIKHIAMYAFNTGKKRDKRPLQYQSDKNKAPIYEKTDIEEKEYYKEKPQQFDQQSKFQKALFFKTDPQKLLFDKKAQKLSEFNNRQALQIKHVSEACQATLIIEDLSSIKEQKLANQLKTSLKNGKIVNHFLQLIAKAGLKLDLSSNVEAIRQVLTMIMSYSPNQVLQSQVNNFKDLQNQLKMFKDIYSQFIEKYSQAILEMFRAQDFPFANYMNFYVNFLCNESHIQSAFKSEFFRALSIVMRRIDISTAQNFEALKELIQKIDQMVQRRQFDEVLGQQLIFFEPQTLKTCLICVYLSKAKFQFTSLQISNILEVLLLYCDDYMKSSTLDEVIHLLLSFDKMRNKNEGNYNKLLVLERHYFKAIFANYFQSQAKKSLIQVYMFIDKFSLKVYLLDSQQPHYAKLLLNYFQSQLKSNRNKANQLATELGRVNEIVKTVIFKKLLGYDICKKQFKCFFEAVFPVISVLQDNQDVAEFLFIRDNIQNLHQHQQYKKVDKRHMHPKKLQLMLQKAIQRQDVKWIQQIFKTIIWQKSNFYLLYSSIQPQNYSLFNTALGILKSKNQLKLVRSLLKHTLEKQMSFVMIKVIIRFIHKWRELEVEAVWEMLSGIWLQLAAQKRSLTYLSLIFVESQSWKLKKYPNQLKHFSSPSFYQILRTIAQVAKTQKQNKKLQLFFYQLLSQLLNRQYFSLLMDSFMSKVLDQLNFKFENFQDYPNWESRKLWAILIWHRLKGFVTKEEIDYFCSQPIANERYAFTEVQKQLITHLQTFYAQATAQMPSPHQIMLLLIANNDVVLWKALQHVKETKKIEYIRANIAALGSKQLVSVLLSPLLACIQPVVVKQIWSALLAKQNQFQYLKWRDLLSIYKSNPLFSNQTRALVNKILKYYSSKFNLLVFQDLQWIFHLIITSKMRVQMRIQSSFLYNFFTSAFYYFLSPQKQLQNSKINAIIAMITDSKIKLTLQMGKSIVRAKSASKDGIYFLWLEEKLSRYQYEQLLAFYFKKRLQYPSFFGHFPMELKQYLIKNYPLCINPQLHCLNQAAPSKTDSSSQDQQTKAELSSIQKSFKHVYANYTYNFITHGNQLILLSDGTYKAGYLRLFMKLAGFIPEAANKKVTQILLNGAVDQKDLEKRFFLKKKPLFSLSADEPDIKNLQHEKNLAEAVASLSSDMQKTAHTYERVSANYEQVSANYEQVQANYEQVQDNQDQFSANYEQVQANQDQVSANYEPRRKTARRTNGQSRRRRNSQKQ